MFGRFAFARLLAAATICFALAASAAPPASADPTPKDVIKVYADIAQAAYGDSLDMARALELAVDAFLAKPTDDNLRAARATWIAARIPYMQTEAFRFGNAIVDDWRGG
jgi:putative iron-regulated protein